MNLADVITQRHGDRIVRLNEAADSAEKIKQNASLAAGGSG